MAEKRKKYIGYRVTPFNEWCNEITIIVDTDEKKNHHILNRLNDLNINFAKQKLYSCDYTYYNHNHGYKSNYLIERKNSIEEICGNFGEGRQRFINEFDRVIEKGHRASIVLEQGSLNDVIFGNYLNGTTQESLLSSILTFEARYNIKTYFVSKAGITDYMLQLMYRNDYYIEAKKKEQEQREDASYYA